MKQFLFKSILPIVAAMAFIACSDDVYPDGYDIATGASGKICFVVSDISASRGDSDVSCRADGAFFYTADRSDSIYVSLMVEDENSSVSRATPIYGIGTTPISVTCRKRTAEGLSYFFSNVLFFKKKGSWVSDPPYWWLNDEQCNFVFYSYAPADIQGATYIMDEETWMPKLDYQVPEVRQQSDIMYHDNVLSGGEIISTAGTVVPLIMKHALANIIVSTGRGMAAGTINKLSIKNVLGHGTLNLADGSWSLDAASVSDFSIDINKASSDDLVLTTATDGTHFMLIPGSNTETSTIDIDFTKANVPDGEQHTKTYSGPITGPWEAGKSYRYVVTISPDIAIPLDDSKPMDAHYEICRATIDADNLQLGHEWEMTASASDGARVTLLPESQLNEFQKQGIWIDRILFKANGSTTAVDQGSARGEPTLTGSGSEKVCIFLPENISDSDRIITLTMRIAGKVMSQRSITQAHPAWTGSDFGWEQYENDNRPAQWGFLWDRIVTYEKANPGLNLMVYGPLIADFVSQYDPANNYTTIQEMSTLFGGRTRITIDYTSLNDVSGLNLTSDDGETNTRNLYYHSAGAATGYLENAITALAPGPDFFAYTECGVFNVENVVGGDIPTATALAYTLKKNRYNLLRIEKIFSSITVMSEIPVIDSDDIVWYLPAVNQLNQSPKEGDPWEGVYWSSNPVGSENAFTAAGAGAAPAYRMNYYKIRACRNKP